MWCGMLGLGYFDFMLAPRQGRAHYIHVESMFSMSWATTQAASAQADSYQEGFYPGFQRSQNVQTGFEFIVSTMSVS